jgi:aminopeptidase N
MNRIIQCLVRRTGILCALLSAACAMAQSDWRVTQFTLQLEPQFETRTIQGSLQMDFSTEKPGLQQLTLDAGNLRIASVQLGQVALTFEKTGSQLHVQLPTTIKPSTAQQLQIRYSGDASGGLRFDKDTLQVSTAFSTSQWMPCLDDPSVRAPLRLTLVLPPALLSVGNGVLDSVQLLGKDKLAHVWRLESPMPSYLYGFAAGKFTQTQESAGSTSLQYFGPSNLFTSASLQQVFADSADMLAFYAERAGVPYPFAAYRQVLLNGPAAQEAASFSTMGARYGTRVLADPQAIWLGAHEMAHQWWGNGVTNQSWRHFWLNEGIATFMTAAYVEHRFGTAEYQRQIDAARVKYQAVRDAGHDKSLVFEDWDQPTASDRSLVYDKGALVMHELRGYLGEEKFWKALRHYTQKHWGQSVETADFKLSMEEGSEVNLSAFFEQWVSPRQSNQDTSTVTGELLKGARTVMVESP